MHALLTCSRRKHAWYERWCRRRSMRIGRLDAAATFARARQHRQYDHRQWSVSVVAVIFRYSLLYMHALDIVDMPSSSSLASSSQSSSSSNVCDGKIIRRRIVSPCAWIILATPTPTLRRARNKRADVTAKASDVCFMYITINEHDINIYMEWIFMILFTWACGQLITENVSLHGSSDSICSIVWDKW